MTRYLLDTNVVSELRKRKPHGGVVAWLASLHADQIFVSAVTIGELQTGVEMTRRQDAAKAQEIRALERTDIPATIMDAARRRPVQPCDAASECALAGTGFANQRQCLTSCDREADAADRMHGFDRMAEPGTPHHEIPAQVSDFQQSPARFGRNRTCHGFRSGCNDDARYLLL